MLLFFVIALHGALTLPGTAETVTDYCHGASGNVIERREEDGSMATFAYDALNRLTRKSYTGAAGPLTPMAVLCYDGQSYAAASQSCTGAAITQSNGKLTAAGSNVSATSYQYDALGRVASSTQTTDGAYYPFVYSYYMDDRLASVRYPSQKTVSYCYDALGRAIWASKSRTAADCTAGLTQPAIGDHYVRDVVYGAHGAIAGLQFGNGLYEWTQFNARNQPEGIGLGTAPAGSDRWKLEYGYGATNNGNIESAAMTLPSGALITTKYRYDGVNRLKAAVEDPSNEFANPLCYAGNGRWCQEFGYDERGNRTVYDLGLGSRPGVPGSFQWNNRVADSGWSYDGRGNVTAVPSVAAQANRMLYDGEDRLAAYCKESAGCVDTTAAANKTVYGYDAEGRRVKKAEPAQTTYFVYDAFGNLAAEYVAGTGSAQEVSYLTSDHLGSVRVVTKANGQAAERHDYLPFGEELTIASGNPRFGVEGYGRDATRLRFTGKERDAETGLDYFGARYLSSAHGRFTSVDPTLESAKPTNPQSWNRYTYALNNPLRYTDPDGRIPVETILDLANLAQSLWELGRNPSWAAAGYAAWDLGAVVLPYAPGSWVAKVAKYGHQGLEAAGVLNKLDHFEGLVNNQYAKQGVALLGQGDDSVRQVLGLSSADKAADFLGVTQSGKYIIGEAKGSDLASAVAQLGNTAKALTDKLGNVKFSAEVVLRKGQKIDPNFRVSGTQLERFNVKTKKWDLQKAEGQAINVRYLDE